MEQSKNRSLVGRKKELLWIPVFCSYYKEDLFIMMGSRRSQSHVRKDFSDLYLVAIVHYRELSRLYELTRSLGPFAKVW